MVSLEKPTSAITRPWSWTWRRKRRKRRRPRRTANSAREFPKANADNAERFIGACLRFWNCHEPLRPGYLSLMISVHDLTKLYANLTAVSHLSFDIAGGEVLGLVGPNGAGKTTTLRCLCGIMAPSAGKIVVAGHDIQTDAVEAKRALAFIP